MPTKEVTVLPEFLKYSEPLILMTTALIIFSILVQSLVFIISLYWKPKKALHRTGNILEFFILMELLAFSLMQGHMVYIRFMTIFPAVGYKIFRIAIFIALLCSAMANYIFIRKNEIFIIIMASMATLPVMERILGRGFPVVFILSLIIILCRGLYIGSSRFKDIKTEFSSFTLKSAIDTLDSGILFCEPDGYILLLNEKMQNLMQMLTGAIYRNGIEFYEFLLEVFKNTEETNNESEVFCRIQDGSTWMVSKTPIKIKEKKYIQISSMDVTERWRLTEELKEQKNKLSKKSNELQTTLANLQRLSHEKEIQGARMRAHDVLGNRLSFVLRSLSHGDFSDYKTLYSITEGLFEEMKSSSIRPTPVNELLSLQETFQAVGIEIKFQGDLPEDIYISTIFTEIIREAVTNAVRHGFATEIIIVMETKDDAYHLKIKDNGQTLEETIAEGSGIKGMRKRIALYNGSLDIIGSPSFTISIEVPRG